MRVTVHLDFIEPVFNMRKGFFPGNIIHEQGTDGTAVVGASDGSEILLTSCVPDLKLNILFLDRDCFSTELYSNSYIMSCAGFTLNKLEDDTRLADSSIADDDELEKVMVGVHYCACLLCMMEFNLIITY